MFFYIAARYLPPYFAECSIFLWNGGTKAPPYDAAVLFARTRRGDSRFARIRCKKTTAVKAHSG